MGVTKPSVPTGPKSGALFNKIINDGRERQRSQDLANAILSSKRRRSVGPTARKTTSPHTGSLASRVGVNKQTRSASVTPTSHPTPNQKLPSLGSRVSSPAAKGLCSVGPPKAVLKVTAAKPKHTVKPKPGSLSARITNGFETAFGPKGAKLRGTGPPAGTPTGPSALRKGVNGVNNRKNNIVNNNAKNTKQIPREATQLAMRTKEPVSEKSSPKDTGISIRGLAGPFAVIARNFAPGTTAADISSAMSNVGGEIISCEILVSTPTILAEIVFATREGGERVIARFHNQTADGYTLEVFAKPGNHISPTAAPRRAPAQVIDGTNGFTASSTPGQHTQVFNVAPTGGLYSDDLMAGIRKGRGFGKDGGSREGGHHHGRL